MSTPSSVIDGVVTLLVSQLGVTGVFEGVMTWQQDECSVSFCFTVLSIKYLCKIVLHMFF